MAWLLLACAILTEVVATTALKYTNGLNILTHTGLTLFVCVFYITSYVCMAQALKLQMEVSVAYAMWSGIGTAAITVIGATLFRESLHPIKVGAITLIVVGVALLNLVPETAAVAESASNRDATARPMVILGSAESVSDVPARVGRHRAYGGIGRAAGLAAAAATTNSILVPRQRRPVNVPELVETVPMPRHARPAWGYIEHAPPPISVADLPHQRLSDPLASTST